MSGCDPVPLAGWMILAVGMIMGHGIASRAMAAERPNFLLIVTDDQATDTLRAYGNSDCHTPHIDRLAREGMVLLDAHHMGSWSGAVCLPSRTMIMTGRSLWRIPGAPTMPSAAGGNSSVPAVVRTCLPALFREVGYATFRTCKRSNTFAPANERFAVRWEADKRGSTAESGSAWHADRALDFLAERASRNDRAPFLMFLGFSHPHDPRHGPPELMAKYGAVEALSPPPSANPAAPPLPTNYLPRHPFPHGHPGLRDETQVAGVGTDRSATTIRNELGREYACIENIDRQIGRVLDRLTATGELQRTFVIFTADHGIAVGRHGLVGKQNLYEHTWRVPLIVRGPGIRAGSEAAGFVYLLDLLPTLCDLAGMEIPAELEGRSFRPVLEGKQTHLREVLYGVYCGGTKPGIRSVKTPGWKLIKYDVLEGAVRQTQLFHLAENPRELLEEHQAAGVIAATHHVPERPQVNLADDPRYREERQELEALLLAEQQRWGDPYRLWDQPPQDAAPILLEGP